MTDSTETAITIATSTPILSSQPPPFPASVSSAMPTVDQRKALIPKLVVIVPVKLP